MAPIKIVGVVVGDGLSGKSCLLNVFTKNEFPERHIPTRLEVYETKIEFRGKQVHFELWEPSGQTDYDRLRPLLYHDIDVIFICFSIDEPQSLINVSERWIMEVEKEVPNVPIVLVGNKKDLRNDPSSILRSKRPVSTEEGHALKDRIKAFAYVEASAMCNEGISEVFVTATQAVFQANNHFKRQIKKTECCHVL